MLNTEQLEKVTESAKRLVRLEKITKRENDDGALIFDGDEGVEVLVTRELAILWRRSLAGWLWLRAPRLMEVVDRLTAFRRKETVDDEQGFLD